MYTDGLLPELRRKTWLWGRCHFLLVEIKIVRRAGCPDIWMFPGLPLCFCLLFLDIQPTLQLYLTRASQALLSSFSSLLSTPCPPCLGAPFCFLAAEGEHECQALCVCVLSRDTRWSQAGVSSPCYEGGVLLSSLADMPKAIQAMGLWQWGIAWTEALPASFHQKQTEDKKALVVWVRWEMAGFLPKVATWSWSSLSILPCLRDRVNNSSSG